MKKFMALLATGLVMALSATTIFAAEDVTVEAVRPLYESTFTVESGNVDVGNNEITSVVVNDRSAEVDTLEEAEALLDEIEADLEVLFVEVRVKSFADITITLKDAEVSEENPVWFDIYAIGGDDMDQMWVVFYKNSATGEWESTVSEYHNDKIMVKLTQSSPMMLASFAGTEHYEKPNETPSETPDDGWYYDPESSETPESNESCEVKEVTTAALEGRVDAGNNVVASKNATPRSVEEANTYIGQIETDNNFRFVNPRVKSFTDIQVVLNGEVAVSLDNPVYIDLEVFDIDGGERWCIFNQDTTTGKWDKVVFEDRGGVTKAKFTHFSPVMVLQVDGVEPAVVSSWYYDPAIDGPIDPSLPSTATTDGAVEPSVGGVTTSPKTGGLPVAAFVAVISLAGAVVCGKKVK